MNHYAFGARSGLRLAGPSARHLQKSETILFVGPEAFGIGSRTIVRTGSGQTSGGEETV